MEVHRLNYESSRLLFEQNTQEIYPNLCYNNVFQLREIAELEGWTVAYGYFGHSGNCYVRHCFFINEFGEVIDPSIFFGMEDLETTHSFFEYRVFAELEMEPYLEMILENELNPNLKDLLVAQEENAYAWFLENNQPIERKSYPYLSDFDTDNQLNVVDFAIANR